MFECVRLDPNHQPDPFRESAFGLLPKHLQKAFREKSKSIIPIAIAARAGDAPAGIVFAFYHATAGFARIEHLFVAEEHRNQHIGRQLLASLEKEVKPRTVLDIIYPENEPESPQIEKMLKAGGYTNSRPFIIRCVFEPATFYAPWIDSKFRYPKGCKEFRWKELREKDRKSIDTIQKQGHFPAHLSPFKEEETIEMINSLGLRMNGEVVGWIITHRVDPDTVRYSAFYIDHSLRGSGAAIHLLASSIRRHVAMPTPVAVMDVSLDQADASWVKLVKRGLVPYAKKVIMLRQAWKLA